MQHPSGVVAPFSLLVPVVGMSTSWLVLGERYALIELVAGTVVITGVLLGSRQPRDRTKSGQHVADWHETDEHARKRWSAEDPMHPS